MSAVRMLTPMRSPKTDDSMNLRDCAVACAEAGFKVLRLPPNAKFPPFGGLGWPDLPVPTPQQARGLWTDSHGNTTDNNIAIQTGLGFFVLDFDARHGGDQSLAALDPLLPDTLTVATPNGVHVYLAHDMPLRNGSDIFAGLGLPGVDLRSHHGYVVAPGSTIDGNPYRIINFANIAAAPAEITRLIGERRTQPRVEQSPVSDLDTDAAFSLVEKWLQSRDGLNGDSCDGRTFSVAARLKDFGLSEDATVAVLFEHEQALGPIANADAMERAIRNAYHYAQERAPGIEIAKLPQNEFQPVPGDDGQRPEGIGHKYNENNDLSGRQPEKEITRPKVVLEPWQSLEVRSVEWLVRDLIPAGAFGAIYGEPGSYKSFVALHIAAMLGRDAPVLGKPARRPDHQPDVIYVAAEGGFGIGKRTAAFDHVHPGEPSRVTFVRHPLDFRSGTGDAQDLVNAIAGAGLRPCLVIVDTLARTFAGGAENSPEDMGAYVRVMDSLRGALQCAVLLVHHSGKDKARGMRGHSSLLGAVDTEIELRKVVSVGNSALDAVGAGELKVSKQKDDADGWTMDYAVQRVHLGWATDAAEDIGGLKDRRDAITSLAIRDWRSGERRPGVLAIERMSDTGRAVLDALRGLGQPGQELDFQNARRKISRRVGTIGRTVWNELEKAGAVLRDHDRGTIAISASFEADLSELDGEV